MQHGAQPPSILPEALLYRVENARVQCRAQSPANAIQGCFPQGTWLMRQAAHLSHLLLPVPWAQPSTKACGQPTGEAAATHTTAWAVVGLNDQP